MQIDKHRHHIQTALDSLTAVPVLLFLVHFLGRNLVSHMETKPLCKYVDSKTAFLEVYLSIFASVTLRAVTECRIQLPMCACIIDNNTSDQQVVASPEAQRVG